MWHYVKPSWACESDDLEQKKTAQKLIKSEVEASPKLKSSPKYLSQWCWILEEKFPMGRMQFPWLEAKLKWCTLYGKICTGYS